MHYNEIHLRCHRAFPMPIIQVFIDFELRFLSTPNSIDEITFHIFLSICLSFSGILLRLQSEPMEFMLETALENTRTQTQPIIYTGDYS